MNTKIFGHTTFAAANAANAGGSILLPQPGVGRRYTLLRAAISFAPSAPGTAQTATTHIFFGTVTTVLDSIVFTAINSAVNNEKIRVWDGDQPAGFHLAENQAVSWFGSVTTAGNVNIMLDWCLERTELWNDGGAAGA